MEYVYPYTSYSHHTDFFDTTLAKFPRKSCEAIFDRLMNSFCIDENKGFKDNMSFLDIDDSIRMLIVEKRQIF